MFATVNRDEDADPLEYPKPVPRPGAADRTPDQSDPSDPSPAQGPSAASPDTGPEHNPSPVELAQFFA